MTRWIAVLSLLIILAACEPSVYTGVSQTADVETAASADIDYGQEQLTPTEPQPQDAGENTPPETEKKLEKEFDKLITVEEGELVSLGAKAKDPDGDEIVLTFSNPLNAEGKWQTKEGDRGVYEVTVEAHDGETSVTKNVQIIVKEKNRPPKIKFIPPVTLKAGDTVRFEPEVSDPNNDQVIMTYSGWINTSEYTTTEADLGDHEVTITASDGRLVDKKFVKIIVIPKNNPPKIEDMAAVEVYEGDTIKLEPKVTDPDGDRIRLTFSGWMTSDSYTTGYEDAGSHTVTITASDGKAIDVKEIIVTVRDRNRAPELEIVVG